jgi:hypothetical protein
MNRWLDIALVAFAVLVSAGYAAYSLGPKSIKNTYSKVATKYLGLRAAKWFSPAADSCNSCSSGDAHHPSRDS